MMECICKNEDAFVDMCFGRRFDLAIALTSKITTHTIRDGITGEMLLMLDVERKVVESPCGLYKKTLNELVEIEMKRNRRQFNKEV